MAPIRSTVFVDGNNWYHGLRSLGLDSGDLDYQRLAKKLLMGRRLQGIRYYVGKVSGDLPRVRAQERSLAALRQQGVVVELGRIERNLMPADRNPLAVRLRQLLAAERDAVPPGFAEQLDALCAASIPYFVEKQVDVRIAVDMVGMAYRSEYDVAYLLSADGDFVPPCAKSKDKARECLRQAPPRATSSAMSSTHSSIYREAGSMACTAPSASDRAFGVCFANPAPFRELDSLRRFEQNSHRPVVHQRHLHVGAEFAGANSDAAFFQATHVAPVKRQRDIRRRRCGKTGAIAAPGVRGQRELRHREHRTADIEHRAVHGVVPVPEDPRRGGAFGETPRLRLAIVPLHAHEDEQPRPDGGDFPTRDRHARTGYSLQQSAHLRLLFRTGPNGAKRNSVK